MRKERKEYVRVDLDKVEMFESCISGNCEGECREKYYDTCPCHQKYYWDYSSRKPIKVYLSEQEKEK